ALLNSASIRPNVATAALNSAATDAAFVTSVGTTTAFGRLPPDSASDSRRRPANTTRWPASSRARAVPRPMPLPAPVITTILFTSPIVPHPTVIRPCPHSDWQGLRDTAAATAVAGGVGPVQPF